MGMDVFDRFRSAAAGGVRGLGDAVEKTVRRTNLKTQVSRQEAVMRDACAAIGQLVAARADAGETPPPGCEEPLAVIRTTRAELARLRSELEALDAPPPAEHSDASGPVCHACGGPVATNQRFCIRCGAPVHADPPQAEPARGPACPACGAAFVAGQRFCTHCGASLAAVEPPPDPPAPPPPATCPQCGGTVLPEQHFCMHCGGPLAAPVPEEAPAPNPVPPSCAACGAPLRSGQQFCTQCGSAAPAGAQA